MTPNMPLNIPLTPGFCARVVAGGAQLEEHGDAAVRQLDQQRSTRTEDAGDRQPHRRDVEQEYPVPQRGERR